MHLSVYKFSLVEMLSSLLVAQCMFGIIYLALKLLNADHTSTLHTNIN